MSKELFDQRRRNSRQFNSDFAAEHRAFGAIDVSEFVPEVAEIVNSMHEFGLWYAAEEAKEVGNATMLNLIALSALNGIAKSRDLMMFEDLRTKDSFLRSTNAVNHELSAENFEILYGEVTSWADELSESESEHSNSENVSADSLASMRPQELVSAAYELDVDDPEYAIKMAQIATIALNKAVAARTVYRSTFDASLNCDANDYYAVHEQVLNQLIFQGSVKWINSRS